jgi:DNA polymerase III alpha subunit (gram-positive type)
MQTEPDCEYFSVDIETDGLTPGLYSMISIGIVHLPRLLRDDGSIVSLTMGEEFQANLKRLPGTSVALSVMEFWDQYPDAYTAARRDLKDPDEAILSMAVYVKRICGPRRAVFVASPTSFDYAFICHYSHKFLGYEPFHYATLDIRSLMMGLRRLPFEQSRLKDHFPELDDTKIHIAIEDARHQAAIFIALMRQVFDAEAERRAQELAAKQASELETQLIEHLTGDPKRA